MEWRKIKTLCANCGQPLEARPILDGVSFVIQGLEPMEYRHVAGGCEYPHVYSGWGCYDEWVTKDD